jgi:mono/diheme cytochrome c family protein
MHTFGRCALVALLLGLAVSSASMLSAQTAAPAGDAKRGHDLFVAMGCYECHNYQGQASGRRAPGQAPGPNIAPAPIAYSAFLGQLRHPRVAMPPYDAVLLSDADVADIYAYLSSVPAAKDPKTIPVLASVDTGSSTGVTRGQEVFAANCATCHGATAHGTSIAPSLVGESARKDAAAVEAFVKNPPSPMTKLYPGLLNAADVAAVATYVETLH